MDDIILEIDNQQLSQALSSGMLDGFEPGMLYQIVNTSSLGFNLSLFIGYIGMLIKLTLWLGWLY